MALTIKRSPSPHVKLQADLDLDLVDVEKDVDFYFDDGNTRLYLASKVSSGQNETRNIVNLYTC
jgi:hypothetical protein